MDGGAPLTYLFAILAGLGIVLVLVGVIGALSQRGATTRSADLVLRQEQVAEPLEGRASVGSTRGWETSVRKTATYTVTEIRDALARGDAWSVWPVFAMVSGWLMAALFGGLALLLVEGGEGGGIAILAILGGGVWGVGRDVVRRWRD